MTIADLTVLPTMDWRVERLDAKSDMPRIQSLIETGRIVEVLDTIEEQLADFVRTFHPHRKLSENELRELIHHELGGDALNTYGCWIYYSWSRRLVHVLPKEAFRRLRADRNHYKISPAEEEKLRGKTIGIVGLSVGLAAARTLALEGVGGHFRLADFDTLGLSNLNRLTAGVQDLGINKAVLAARVLLELDPYLDVEVFADGITDETIHRFLAMPMDLLVEECDDLAVKVRLREEAARLRIPVMMETSDRGLLDIERFDLDPERLPFHGLAGILNVDVLKSLSAKEKIPFVLRILDSDQLSPAVCASMVEIGSTISTWPQLGSAVALGGAVVTDVARRILLGKLVNSGRYYVDLETIINDKCQVILPPIAAVVAAASSREDRIEKPVTNSGAISLDEVNWLVTQAAMAPSGGNAQPWRFRFSNSRLDLFLDRTRRSPLLDFEFTASFVGLGAAAMNLDLAARELNLEPSMVLFPENGENDLVASFTFQRSNTVVHHPDLATQIPLRVTNRHEARRQPLSLEHASALITEAMTAGASLQLLTSPAELAEMGDMIGQGDRLRFLSEPMHRELMSELRWSTEEATSTRDGIDVSTLEMSPTDRGVLGILSNWPAMAHLRAAGAGQGLEGASRRTIEKSAAVGLLRFPGHSSSCYFQGGQALERVWLRASALGLAMQPMSVLLYFFAAFERGGADSFSRDEQDRLHLLRRRFDILFGPNQNHAEILLFRVGFADPPTSRSLRRNLPDILCIE